MLNKSFKTMVFLLAFLQLFTVFSFAGESIKKDKVIYLTFDDGPAGKVTTDVLDVLKENNVHATFFLIGDQIKNQESVIKRMVDEGHSIGLHSMSHKKCNLYSSEDNFLSEMLKTQEIIQSITGFKPNILRFPFGCNNNRYKITKSMVDLLHKNNLKIYDWNVDSGDGCNPKCEPSKFVKNSKSDKDKIILLMHCAYMSKNTVKALPSIIKYYKDNNYTFKIIDENTPEEFHYIKIKN